MSKDFEEELVTRSQKYGDKIIEKLYQSLREPFEKTVDWGIDYLIGREGVSVPLRKAAARSQILQAHQETVREAEVALLEGMLEDERGNREAGYQTSRGWFIKWAEAELERRKK